MFCFVFLQEKKFVLETNGARIAKVSVFETNRLSKNNLVGYCEIDLLEFLSRVSFFTCFFIVHSSLSNTF
ncbi:putative phosphatidylserine decarboxylase [Helianthus anomalus]